MQTGNYPSCWWIITSQLNKSNLELCYISDSPCSADISIGFLRYRLANPYLNFHSLNSIGLSWCVTHISFPSNIKFASRKHFKFVCYGLLLLETGFSSYGNSMLFMTKHLVWHAAINNKVNNTVMGIPNTARIASEIFALHLITYHTCSKLNATWTLQRLACSCDES